MKLVLVVLIVASGLSININAMSLNDKATCGVLFSTASSINRQQGNLKKSKIWKQKMLDMINNMRRDGYSDDTITKAIGSNMPRAMEMMKFLQNDKSGYKKFINRCLDEIEK